MGYVKKSIEELPELAEGVKKYVAQAMYGMYSLKNYPASYVIYMGRLAYDKDLVIYVLDKEGRCIRKVNSMDGKKHHKDIIMFK